MDKCNTCYKWSKDGCYDKTRSCQYVEKKPVIKAAWVEYNPFSYRCTNCGNVNKVATNFCPNCGADMREVEE